MRLTRRTLYSWVAETNYSPTVQTQGSKNKLREVVLGMSMPMGNSKSGSDWALKALHPAEPTVPEIGIPDCRNGPSVTYNLTQCYTIHKPTGGASNYNATCAFWANPVIFGGCHTYDGVNSTWEPITNTQLSVAPADTYKEFTRTFCGAVEAYRLAYASVTLHQDATSVSDSGTFGCAQYIMEPTPVAYVANPGYCTRKSHVWCDRLKTWEQLQNLPNAYMAPVRDGLYAPFKLTDFEFSKTNDFGLHNNCTDAPAFANPVTWGDEIAFQSPVISLPEFPYGIKGTSGTDGPVLTLPNCSRNVVHISAKNLHPDATIQVTIRYCFELLVPPGSRFASFVKTPTNYDPVAIEAYFGISRRLADAYPGEYNEFGKILSNIWNVAKSILPMIFPAAGGVMAAGEGAFKAFNSIRKRAGKGKTPTVAPKSVTAKAKRAPMIGPRRKPKGYVQPDDWNSSRRK